MADQAFRILVRIYRFAGKGFVAIKRIFKRFAGREIVLFRLFDAPVSLSFSFFLLAILPAFILFVVPLKSIFSLAFQLIPIFLIAAFLPVLVHELGHMYFVRKFKFRVEQIYISALSGECRYSCPVNVVPPVLIAYGGILAQALFLILLVGVRALLFNETDSIMGYPNFLLFWI